MTPDECKFCVSGFILPSGVCDNCDTAIEGSAIDIGRKWLADSSLEKWFPLTAEELAKLRAENAKLRADSVNLCEDKTNLQLIVQFSTEIDKLRAQIAELKASTTAKAQ